VAATLFGCGAAAVPPPASPRTDILLCQQLPLR
jgi:hypothetical protein